MDSLRKKLWDRLRGKSEKLDQALAQAEQEDKKALETIAKNLDVEMDDDETFATEMAYSILKCIMSEDIL